MSTSTPTISSRSTISSRRLWLLLAALALGAVAVPHRAMGDDIEVFVAHQGSSAPVANVMILIDNSSNWARQSQAWGTSNGVNINQGQAEVQALSKALGYFSSSAQAPLNVGLAMLTPNNVSTSTGGGYVRFGARDINSGSAQGPQNLTALQNILSGIFQYTNGGGQLDEECCGMNHKDETAAFYELYKYFSGLAPYTGTYPANPWDDFSGNTGGGSTGSSGLTAYAQGLTSGFAMASGSGPYQSPISSTQPCAANYIIYIANNTKGNIGSTESVYEPSVVPALSPLPATSTDTWLDEWTRYLYKSGAVAPAGTNGTIVTYVLDAWNSQNDPGYTASLESAAIQGGGQYYHVSSGQEVYNALVSILTQIQAVNSTFTSASVPVNATNRAQDKNQVFVPMFRPDAHDQPRWMGNLKRYQLISSGGTIQLGDALGQPAINLLTGLPNACSASFWTTDSTDLTHYPNGYWNYTESINASGYWNTTIESQLAKGACATSAYGPYSDDPDGPITEKGGVAEVIRKGNNPSTTNSTPTWSPSQRTVLTTTSLTSTSLVSFNASNSKLDPTLVSWMLGQDAQDENGNGNTSESRPSLHGDSVHSRPLPVDYGTGGVKVFYGSNDGMLRAVDAASGQELWAFVAPEFYSPAPAIYPGATPTGLERLMWSAMTDAGGNQISPLVSYPGMPPGVTPAPTPKDYYFDGSIGLYESAINTTTGSAGKVWIYPSMRRGGRMIYALDVTDPDAPQILWKFGCAYQTNDSVCVSNGVASAVSTVYSSPSVASIGETWSTPIAATSVLGYPNPVVVMGGGYDPCEDANTPTPTSTSTTPNCSSEKGAGVFVLDAATGAQVGFFPTLRSVAADVALIAVANAGAVDHAYAADTGGNIYRIDFGTDPTKWAIHLVAYTHGGYRKFLYSPALLAAPNGHVYVALGSGDREHPLQSEYPYSTPVMNRFYVYIDSLTSTGASDYSDLSGAVNLDGMTSLTCDPSNTQTCVPTSCSTPEVLPDSPSHGWFIDLNQYGPGEQTVTSAIVASGMVAFSTYRPVAQSTGTCSASLGQTNGYWLNLFNASGGITPTGQACGGNRSASFVEGGLPGSPVVATVPVNGQVVQVIIGAAQRSGGASCTTCPQQLQPAIVPARKTIFWKSSGEN